MLKMNNKIEQMKTEIKLGMLEVKQYLAPNNDINKAINAYLNGQVGKFGNYFALPNALVFRKVFYSDNNTKSDLKQEIIALDINGEKIGNSSILDWVGAEVSFGNVHRNNIITDIQEKLSQFITMVPFTVFNESGLDIRKLRVIEKLKEETFKIKIDNPEYLKLGWQEQETSNLPKTIVTDRHFTGACLFEIEGNCFIFDVDREELKHKIFNPFLVKIPKPVNSIKEAYETLIPEEVKRAMKQGLEVIRQGEFFYIPTDIECEPDTEVERWSRKTVKKRFELRAGRNRPNYATEGNEQCGVIRGKVEHSGREHRVVTLKTWHKAVPNTAIESFTISGQID